MKEKDGQEKNETGREREGVCEREIDTERDGGGGVEGKDNTRAIGTWRMTERQRKTERDVR